MRLTLASVQVYPFPLPCQSWQTFKLRNFQGRELLRLGGSHQFRFNKMSLEWTACFQNTKQKLLNDLLFCNLWFPSSIYTGSRSFVSKVGGIYCMGGWETIICFSKFIWSNIKTYGNANANIQDVNRTRSVPINLVEICHSVFPQKVSKLDLVKSS